MLKFYRYILFSCNRWLTKHFMKKIVSKPTINSFYALLELVTKLHSKGEEINMPMVKRCNLTISSRVSTVVPLLHTLNEVLITARRKDLKYLSVPKWFLVTPVEVKYDYFMEINGIFIKEVELIDELYLMLTALDTEMGKQHNVKMKEYYQVKMSKLYIELLNVLREFN